MSPGAASRTAVRSGASRRLAPLLAVLLVVAGSLTGCSSSSDSSPVRLSEVAALLARHGRAVLAHDRHGFLADVSSSSRARAFRSAQTRQYANLERLPLSHWSYSIDARTGDHAAEAAAGRRYGSAAIIVRITLHYALRRADGRPTTHPLWWTFVRQGGRVVAVADDGLADAGGASWRGPWDLGPLSVVRGTSSLVIGHAGGPDLATIAGVVDAAVPTVTAVWGQGWSRYVAVLVPASADELSADVGEGSPVTTDVAAAAISDGTDPVSGDVLGQRLVVNPAALARLSVVGRRIVVQHEVTHIASAAATTEASPRWLVEGFADYVGNLGSGQPPKVAAAELRADVAAGRLPAALPVSGAFDATVGAPQAYEEAWLACRLIAAKIGPDGLVRFYRRVGADLGDTAGALGAALRSELHLTVAQFTAQWRRYLRTELG